MSLLHTGTAKLLGLPTAAGVVHRSAAGTPAPTPCSSYPPRKRPAAALCRGRRRAAPSSLPRASGPPRPTPRPPRGEAEARALRRGGGRQRRRKRPRWAQTQTHASTDRFPPLSDPRCHLSGWPHRANAARACQRKEGQDRGSCAPWRDAVAGHAMMLQPRVSLAEEHKEKGLAP